MLESAASGIDSLIGFAPALGALELARRTAAPGLRLTPAVARDPHLKPITADRYYERRDDYGTPAWSVSIPVGELAGRATAQLSLPRDAAATPWRLRAGGTPRLMLCRL